MKNITFKLSLLLVIVSMIGCSEKEQQYPVVVTGGNTVYNESLSVMCTGEVTNDGNSDVFERGICYLFGYGIPTTSNNKVSGGSGKGAFSCAISISDTGMYSYCAYASNMLGTAYGDVKTFYIGSNTPPPPPPPDDQRLPSVTTGNATIDQSNHTVTCVGTIRDIGSSSLTQAGICYMSGVGNPTISNAHAAASNAASLNSGSAFSVRLLDVGYGQYSYRAYATNEHGTTYGETRTFNISMPENSVIVTFDGTTWVDEEPSLNITPYYWSFPFNVDSSYFSYAYRYWLYSVNINESSFEALDMNFFPILIRTYDGMIRSFDDGYAEYSVENEPECDDGADFYIVYNNGTTRSEDEWVAKSFHISITRFDPVAQIASITLEAVMMNRSQAITNGIGTAETKYLSLTANNISFDWFKKKKKPKKL